MILKHFLSDIIIFLKSFLYYKYNKVFTLLLAGNTYIISEN